MKSITYNEVLECTVRKLDGIILCTVRVTADNANNVVACADKFDDFVDHVIGRAITLSGLFGVRCI